MKNPWVKWGWVLVWGCAIGTAQASGRAQELNPLFVEAQNVHNELNRSAASPAVKQGFDARWNPLNAEQQSLWAMAGEVDAALSRGNTPSFLDSYNSRVLSWQGQLQTFTSDARGALAQLRGVAHDSQEALRGSTPESIASGSGRGFDTPGTPVSGAVPGFGAPSVESVPIAVRNDPAYQKLEQQATVLSQTKQSVVSELAKVRQQRQQGDADGQLMVQEAQLKQKLSNVENQLNYNQYQKDEIKKKYISRKL